ncbi:MAG: TIGR01777 family oxidoreductase [Solirubrobacteraceae bacterium]
MRRVVITGATGTIGIALSRALSVRGDTVIALSRDVGRAAHALGPGVQVQAWVDPTARPPDVSTLAGADAVVNLLGEPISQRWSAQVKQRIRDSRVIGTRNLVAGLRALEVQERPRVLVSQSATGFYGPLGDEAVDETAGGGSDFLAGVVQDWEAEALALSGEARVVVTRTGVVLSPGGGALGKMLPFFRLGIGGPVASGRQYIAWVHLDDVVGAILCCLDDERAIGPVNVTAPAPVSNRAFSRALGRVLHRPAVMPVPSLALQVLYGEMAQIVTTGQRVMPARLGALGYTFAYPQLEPALSAVLSH